MRNQIFFEKSRDNFFEFSNPSGLENPSSKEDSHKAIKLSSKEMKDLFEKTKGLLLIKDNSPNFQIEKNFVQLYNQMLEGSPHSRSEYLLYSEIVLKFWKFLAHKRKQNFKALEMLRKVVPILQGSEEKIPEKTTQKIRNKFEEIMVIYAKEEYGFNNFEEALEVTNKSLRRLLGKDHLLQLNHHEVRQKIFNKLSKEEEELEEINSCLHFIRLIQNRSTKVEIKEPLMKRKEELIRNKQKRDRIYGETLKMFTETKNIFKRKSVSLAKMKSKLNETKKEDFKQSKKKSVVYNTKPKFMNVSKAIGKSKKLIVRKKELDFKNLLLNENLEPRANNFQELLITRPANRKLNLAKAKYAAEKDNDSQLYEEDEGEDLSFESQLDLDESRQQNLALLNECVNVVQREIMDKYEYNHAELRKCPVQDSETQRQQSDENVSSISEEEVFSQYPQGSDKNINSNEYDQSHYQMKNILFPEVGLVGQIKVILRKHHAAMSKTMNYFYDNYLRMQVYFINPWSTDFYFIHNFIISDSDRDHNLSSFVRLFEAAEENGPEGHVMAMLKNNLQLKKKIFGTTFVPMSHKVEKFREEKNQLEFEPTYKKYEEHQKTIEQLKKCPQSVQHEQKPKKKKNTDLLQCQTSIQQNTEETLPYEIINKMIFKYSSQPPSKLKKTIWNIIKMVMGYNIKKVSADASKAAKIVEGETDQSVIEKKCLEELDHYFMGSKESEHIYYFMKICLMKMTSKTDVFMKFFHFSSVQYIFKVELSTYIIHMTTYTIKPIYTVGKSITFYKLELLEKTQRTKLIKLLATSDDFKAILPKFDPQAKETSLLSFLIALSQKISIRKNILYHSVGIETEDKIFYLANSFDVEASKKSQFLSQHLKLFQVLCQKVIKIKSRSNVVYYSVLSVIHIKDSLSVTILLYVASIQKSWSFSLGATILKYLNTEELLQIFPSYTGSEDLEQVYRSVFIQSQKSDLKENWKKLLRFMTFEYKLNSQRSYIIGKISNYHAFIKDCSVCEHFECRGKILKLEIALEKSSGSLNFLSKKIIAPKRRITRVSKSIEEENSNCKQNIIPTNDDYPNIYCSQANNYIVYISLTDIKTDKKINFSYYLCELLPLILAKNEEANLLHNIPTKKDEDHQILTCADLNRGFATIKKDVMGLMNKYTSDQIENIFKCKPEYQDLKDKVTEALVRKIKERKQASKISLNKLITKGQKSTITLLFKKLLLIKKKLIVSILHDEEGQKMKIYISNNEKCEIQEKQIDIRQHPMPFLANLPQSIFPALSSRIFRYHKNIFLLQ